MRRSVGAMPIDHSEATLSKKREIANCQKIHAQKLDAIKGRKAGSGTLDNRLPETAKMKHLKLKLKKLQLQEDRYNEIEHENKLLLQKMARIITTHDKSDYAPSEAPYAKSLNAISRKWELVKVSKENQAILARLEATKPTFDAAEWTAKRADEEKRLKRLQKVRLFMDSSDDVAARQDPNAVEATHSDGRVARRDRRPPLQRPTGALHAGAGQRARDRAR